MTADDEEEPCDRAVLLAFTILGKRWNGAIIDVLKRGPLSFGALRRAVTGISDTVLSDRLGELAQTRLVVRQVEPGPPVAVTYELTTIGRELLPTLRLAGEWAEKYLAPLQQRAVDG
ncbi:helix-turn-helix domain-containing protein [Microbacterium soli]|uniref:HTH hxlR-type domain-containing protein n=1 Tax=Microbacterium soli TaxID=446075 RepID=A0ABP7MVG8_9MICO